MTRVRLIRRLDRTKQGLLSDVQPMGEGVYKMREHFGAGWRMYYIQHGRVVIVMLGGGTKSTQSKDIKQAIAIAIAEQLEN
jgi:putative addiction module killer protein